MKRQDAPSASKPVIGAAEVDTPDAVLLKGRGTHHTRFHSHIQVSCLQDGFRMALKCFGDREEFGVSRALVIVSEIEIHV